MQEVESISELGADVHGVHINRHLDVPLGQGIVKRGRRIM